MNSKGASRFVSEAGPEVSVRTSRDLTTDALMIEPLYATDIELLDGATGTLHADGDVQRGTLRRNGGVFVLTSDEPRPRRVTRRKTQPAPPAVPVVPRVAAANPPASAPATPKAKKSVTVDGEVLEAFDTLLRFVRSERVSPKVARRAHAVIGRFIAERERVLTEPNRSASSPARRSGLDAEQLDRTHDPKRVPVDDADQRHAPQGAQRQN